MIGTNRFQVVAGKEYIPMSSRIDAMLNLGCSRSPAGHSTILKASSAITRITLRLRFSAVRVPPIFHQGLPRTGTSVAGSRRHRD
jgi:hypothetical protein